MITGVSQEKYREINEFPLSEQSRECAAFGKDPLLLGFSVGWKYRKR